MINNDWNFSPQRKWLALNGVERDCVDSGGISGGGPKSRFTALSSLQVYIRHMSVD